jgi:hypothetical protein
MVTDSNHFDEEPDPDPNQSEKSNPDLDDIKVKCRIQIRINVVRIRNTAMPTKLINRRQKFHWERYWYGTSSSL